MERCKECGSLPLTELNRILDEVRTNNLFFAKYSKGIVEFKEGTLLVKGISEKPILAFDCKDHILYNCRLIDYIQAVVNGNKKRACEIHTELLTRHYGSCD